MSTTTELPRIVNFNLDQVEWTQVAAPRADDPRIPEAVRADVDLEEFWRKGMWTSYIDAGAFNLLGVKLAPDFTIPRHHHNLHQLVLVHEGEIWQGALRFGPGDAYFTRAGHPYSVTAGPEGSVAFEIRYEPISELTIVWDEADPAKWVHGRRPHN
ncbi:MAG: hypothetical protein JO337_10955 [Acidimicrobiales bacterium]|nr:hypothetical protein [Acidimicrobiales bacterium]